MLRGFSVPAACPKFANVVWLAAPPPDVASKKLARLKTLNACHSNFRLARSVSLKTLPSVISAYHWPGPRNWLRPKVPVQPRHGAERTGRPDWVTFDPQPEPGFALTRGALPGHHPTAHVFRDSLPNSAILLFGRSFLPPSKLKSPPMFTQ